MAPLDIQRHNERVKLKADLFKDVSLALFVSAFPGIPAGYLTRTIPDTVPIWHLAFAAGLLVSYSILVYHMAVRILDGLK